MVTIFSENKIKNISGENLEMYTDQKKEKWLLGNFSLFYTDGLSHQFRLLGMNAPFPSSKLGNFVYPDSAHNCTLITLYKNLMMFDHKSKQIYIPEYNPIKNPVLKALAGKKISFLMFDKEQNIWAAEWGNGIYRFDAQKQVCTSILTSPPKKSSPQSATCMFQDSHNNIWIGKDHRVLYIYRTSSKKVEEISGDNILQQGLQINYAFNCITEDSDENIWLGTDKGINIFNPYKQYISCLANKPGTTSLSESEITSAFYASNHQLYIGTWSSGFFIFDSLCKYINSVVPKGTYEYPLLWCFTETNNHQVWMGAQHGYIHIYNSSNYTLRTIHPSETENSTIQCMVKDKYGNIWIGLYNGKIIEWEIQSQTFIKQATPGVINNQSQVKSIFIDNKNRCWVSASTGMLLFNLNTHNYINRFQIDNKKDLQPVVNEINGIEQLNDSTLAVGSQHFGFLFFDINNKKFSKFDTRTNPAASNIHAIKKDSSGNLWMTSDYNIFQLQRDNGKLIQYNLLPGLLNSSFDMPDMYSFANRTLLSFSRTEAIFFDPEKMRTTENEKRKIHIATLKVANHELNTDSLFSENNSVFLSAGENCITLEFSSYSYAFLSKVFYYKLEGIDKSWVKANESDVINYSNLAPGEYDFFVKADDNENPERAMHLVITDHFYNLWWFRTVIIGCAILLTYLIIRRHIKSIRHKASMKQQIAETEMMALKAQMNPHFIFNCINSIDGLIQSNDNIMPPIT